MEPEIDIRELAALLRARRGQRGLRLVAQEIGGVSASTLSRIEQGKVPDLDTFIRLCRWLGVSPDRFLPAREAETTPDEAMPPEEGKSVPQIVAAHLRADRTLDPDTAEALVRMIRLAYAAARRGELGNAAQEEPS